MLRVQVLQLRPGMTLASPVLHPQRPDTTLLHSGFLLDETVIDRLQALQVPEVWIKFPGLPFVAQHVSPQIMQQRGAITALMSDLFERMNEEAHADLEWDAYRRTVKSFCQRLIDEPRAALYLQAMAQSDHCLTRHCSDVCFLSLLMGLKQDASLVAERWRLTPHRAKNVASLGLGAMLHDIGLLTLGEGAYQQWLENPDEQDPTWRSHPLRGYRLCRGRIEASAAAVIIHHHQRMDGTGFPTRRELWPRAVRAGVTGGLKGDEIHIYARIAAAANAFDHLRYPVGKPPVPVVMALKRLLAPPYSDWLDPVAVCALLTVAPAYAPGSIVRLSNGKESVVLKWRPTNPCRPTVQFLPEGWRSLALQNHELPTLPIIDLAQRGELSIIETEGHDVSRYNFRPALLHGGGISTSHGSQAA